MQIPSGFPSLLSRAGRVFVFILLLVAGGYIIMTPVAAHPPSDMTVTYHELLKDLSVSITHTVPNPGEHYIKEVTVAINGKVVNDSRYTSQPAPDTFTYTYPIDTVSGDEISVTATCSLTGSISRTLHNTGPIATTPPPGEGLPATKASAGLFSLIGVGIAMFLAGRH
jgi:sulfur carrier protein ThiS